MKKFLALLAVVTVTLGTALSAVPANASKTYLFPPNQNEGGAQN